MGIQCSCCRLFGTNSPSAKQHKSLHSSQNPDIQVNGQLRSNKFNPVDEYALICNDTCQLTDINKKPTFLLNRSNSLQHISDREPENRITDPTLNTQTSVIFQPKNDSVLWYSKMVERLLQNGGRRKFSKANSTSSVYVDCSTVSKPDIKSFTRSVALAIYLMLRQNSDCDDNDDMIEIFDERQHCMEMDELPDEKVAGLPSLKTVHKFISTIFKMAQLSPECLIITVVYLERLQTSASISLSPVNWKRLVLCSILLASKVWDDQAVWNVDYCQILTALKVDDVNELERQFLEIIQFNINVSLSVYTKYYFEIRALVPSSNNFCLLYKSMARRLEACNLDEEDIIEKKPFRHSCSDLYRSRHAHIIHLL